MAHAEAAVHGVYRNGPIAARVLQQGSSNAGRDIAGRDINNRKPSRVLTLALVD
jgi:hypothetical protein